MLKILIIGELVYTDRGFFRLMLSGVIVLKNYVSTTLQ